MPMCQVAVGGERPRASPSDADDLDKALETGEIAGIARVERQSVGVGGSSDEEVGYTAPVGPTVSTTAATTWP